jgi:SAM-dependent methyltransferase
VARVRESISRALDAAYDRRATRALERQLAYQREKATAIAERDVPALIDDFTAHTRALVTRLERHRPIAPNDRILEVGSGAHGHVFFLGSPNAIGVDPLADAYRELFPWWQRRARTLAAAGEDLPFEERSFDLVISDNVVDHARSPVQIVRQLVRVLAPGGLLYFAVNVHHRVYEVMSQLQLAAMLARLPIEVGAFSDHTTHLTPHAAESLFEGLPLTVLEKSCDVAAALEHARSAPPRHVGDRFKRHVFKNALFELIARRRLP